MSRLTGIIAGLLVAALAAPAGAGEVVVVTSFPKELFETYKRAFEAKHPDTKVVIKQQQTNAGVTYLQETKARPDADLFWVSAPDAFATLKAAGLLDPYTLPKEIAARIPAKIGAFPIHDPEGYRKGFAASGYGIMWNTRYLKAKNLPEPREWDDLKKPIYHGHVGISAPSRSGTTHLTVETLLQGEGWTKGWASLLEMGGNFATVTERSFGVPDGVNNGQFGVGIVIDFFGLSSQASGFPVGFAYPRVTTLVPANVGIIKNAPHPKAAAAFIEFLLSPEGQEILLDKKIRRLPVLPAVYAKAPQDYPNPFKDKSIGAAVKFDADVSTARYQLVNSLFDHMITFRLKELRAAWRAIHEAEAALKAKPSAQASGLLARARKLAGTVPVAEKEAADPKFTGIFKRVKKGQAPPKRQAEVEKQWDSFAKKNYAEAQELAAKAGAAAK